MLQWTHFHLARAAIDILTANHARDLEMGVRVVGTRGAHQDHLRRPHPCCNVARTCISGHQQSQLAHQVLELIERPQILREVDHIPTDQATKL